MAMQKRRIDRAQRFRARRVWWERHGAFARGLITGAVLALLAVWLFKVAAATF